MKKRWISFLVILGLTAGLAGCGTQSSQAAGDTKKEDTQTAGRCAKTHRNIYKEKPGLYRDLQ